MKCYYYKKLREKIGAQLLNLPFSDHHPQCQAMQLTVHPENAHAKHLYTSAGFLPTGTEFSDEPVYTLLFRPGER